MSKPIGHSTHTLEEFIRLLQAHAVSRVVDVRAIPRSRHNPQFNRDTLPDSLKHACISYVHMADLGGLRRTTVGSRNTGWRNASFRGYADYMQTSEFHRALERLIKMTETSHRPPKKSASKRTTAKSAKTGKTVKPRISSP